MEDTPHNPAPFTAIVGTHDDLVGTSVIPMGDTPDQIISAKCREFLEGSKINVCCSPLSPAATPTQQTHTHKPRRTIVEPNFSSSHPASPMRYSLLVVAICGLVAATHAVRSPRAPRLQTCVAPPRVVCVCAISRVYYRALLVHLDCDARSFMRRIVASRNATTMQCGEIVALCRGW